MLSPCLIWLLSECDPSTCFCTLNVLFHPPLGSASALHHPPSPSIRGTTRPSPSARKTTQKLCSNCDSLAHSEKVAATHGKCATASEADNSRANLVSRFGNNFNNSSHFYAFKYGDLNWNAMLKRVFQVFISLLRASLYLWDQFHSHNNWMMSCLIG